MDQTVTSSMCKVNIDILLKLFYSTHHISNLTQKVHVLLSYRNQSNDLLCKLIDWFRYEGNTGT